jgi:putative membrane protein
MLRLLLAALHFLALGIGLGAIWGRARALSRPLDTNGLRDVFRNDAWWGVAAALWVTTGLARVFGPFEKGTAYYMTSPFFHAKLGLFLVVFILELWPMIALMGWRRHVRSGAALDTSRAATFSTISKVQTAVVVAMVFLAVAMARGIG